MQRGRGGAGAHVGPQDPEYLRRMHEHPNLLNHRPVRQCLAGCNVPSKPLVVPYVVEPQLLVKFKRKFGGCTGIGLHCSGYEQIEAIEA